MQKIFIYIFFIKMVCTSDASAMFVLPLFPPVAATVWLGGRADPDFGLSHHWIKIFPNNRKDQMWFWSGFSRTHLQSLGVCEDGESAKDVIGMLPGSEGDGGSFPIPIPSPQHRECTWHQT